MDTDKTAVYRFLVTGADKAIADFARVHRAAKAIDDDEIKRLKASDAVRGQVITTQTKLGGVILGNAAAEKQYGAAIDSTAKAIATRNDGLHREAALTGRVTELEKQLQAAVDATAAA